MRGVSGFITRRETSAVAGERRKNGFRSTVPGRSGRRRSMASIQLKYPKAENPRADLKTRALKIASRSPGLRAAASKPSGSSRLLHQSGGLGKGRGQGKATGGPVHHHAALRPNQDFSPALVVCCWRTLSWPRMAWRPMKSLCHWFSTLRRAPSFISLR